MIHCRLEIPEEIELEKLRIMDDFCSDDPDGEFVEEEWQAFYAAHASEALKQYDREVKETMAWAKREGVLV
jgi:hypothetical protein